MSSNTSPTTQPTLLRDYTPPPFLVDQVALDIDIREGHAIVTSDLDLRRNPAASANAALELDGLELELESVAIDNTVLAETAYESDGEKLIIRAVPEVFRLRTVVRIRPDENTQLEGLYRSQDGYFTQCEAEGFRRITYFPDRPDVMARYATTIHADKASLPLLLSNGNAVDAGDEADGRHFARWEDPHPKPCYLFAMVAARLDKRECDFTTRSGRKVKLLVFVEPGKLDQSDFALEALQHAIRWDEDTFGLELDLDQYMIVAVGDFNMGAMENKGLNIFNTRYVLARPDTATDHDYMMIDRVIAHEYFHNWTGNRVTCRDWFQLSLKEGLTVFRDQQYGGDRYSHAVQRIQEVRNLRAAQFPEDAGPMAHPVRPESYVEISNFYTATVYDKGAEVVRMIHTLLGPDRFRAGMDLYFERHDGQAVRIEDFVAAMADASGADLEQFKRWYHQAGTPRVRARGTYDAEQARYTLDFEQHCPHTAAQTGTAPFHVPLRMGLLGEDGQALPLRLAGEDAGEDTNRVLSLKSSRQSFIFEDVRESPVPSLLRGFSAPVQLEFEYSETDLAHLAAHDSDPFNRWEAGQRLALNAVLHGIDCLQAGRPLHCPPALIDVFARVLDDADDDPKFAAEALTLPGAAYVAEQMEVVDPDALFAARLGLRRQLADALEDRFAEAYVVYELGGPYTPDPVSAGKRSLRNLALGYLLELETEAIRKRCLDQLTQADNMTDSIAALGALANCECEERLEALEWFYSRWKNEALVVDKWFGLQATSRLPDTLAQVRALLEHVAFDLRNPNKVRAVIGAFCHGNHPHFHAADGSGYAFAAEQVIALDPINAQIAARLARAFDRWRRFDDARQAKANSALQSILDTPGLSKDTTEVVTRALG